MSNLRNGMMELIAAGSAVSAALRVGLLDELLKGESEETELLDRLKLDRRAGRLVLDLLETHQAVQRDGSKVGAGPALRVVLDMPGGAALTLGMWRHVEEFLRTGEPFIAMDQSANQREAVYQNVVGGLGTLMGPHALQLADTLPVVPKTVLDVGCGSGVWGLAVAQRHPAARVTGLDLPAVLENFTARAASLGLRDRAQPLPGDMHAVEVAANAYDLVIIANVLRLEVAERGEALVARMAKAVAPGGALVVVDALAHGSIEADRARTAYALHLGLRTRSGAVHTPQTITRWLVRAGLPDVQTLPLTDASNMGVLLARKS